MEQEKLARLGIALSDALYSDRIVPEELFTAIGALFDAQTPAFFLRIWEERSAQREREGLQTFDRKLPLLLSRGYDSLIAEDELSRYLPEEKIIINKEMFRSHLDSVDFSALDADQERRLLETLQREAIGLSRDDIILYYNLIKINKLAGKSRTTHAAAPPESPQETAALIMALADTAFGLNAETAARINAGRPVNLVQVKDLIADNIRTNRTNPRILPQFLGKCSDRFVNLLIDFIRDFVTQRNEDPQEMVLLSGLYILLSGSRPDAVEALHLSAPLQAFLVDKIGRVRTSYYAALLFMQSFLYVLFAQVYEIASKYREADDEQRQKLVKLYRADDRLAMLVSNAVNIAGRKITDFKAESREVMTHFKKFTASRKVLVSARDLFETDYWNQR